MSRTSQRAVVPVFIAATTAVGVLSALSLRLMPVPASADIRLPWWSLALLFVATQSTVVNVQLRRETRSIFLSEIPFLLGLLYVSAPGLFAARCLGAFVASALFRRQYRAPAKLAFNTSLAVAEAGAGVACYRLIVWGGDPMAPRAWVGAVAGAVVVCVIAALVVALLIHFLEPLQRLADLGRIAWQAALQAAVTATIGVLVAASLAESPWALVPLIVMIAVLVAAYRAYARLNERHVYLERLHGFTQITTDDTDLSATLRGLMDGVTDLLHAEQARLTFLDAPAGASDYVYRRGTSSVEVGSMLAGPEWEAWVRDRVIERGETFIVSRSTKDAGVRRWLDEWGMREVIVVPLQTDGRSFGMLSVIDRLGEARGFDSGDVTLLETIGTHVGITLHKGRLINQLRHDALHDSLTGLPNRSFFQQELDKALSASAGPACTVGMLDLNAFKDVNDTLGHHHGDELLCEVARRLVAVARDRALIARLGGDEFAILVLGDTDTGQRLAEELIAGLDQPVMIAEVEVSLRGSVGLATAPLHGTSSTILLQRADLAMYAAKDLTTGVKVFEFDLDASVDAKLALVSRLRRAIERGDLEVHMQPKSDLRTGLVRSAEALLRWTDDSGRAVPPDEFIPVAERSGLIRPLTELVLRRSVASCADWQTVAPGVGVAVNLSARSLTDTDLVQLVEHVLTVYRLPAGLLTLELTESSVMADAERTLTVLQQLRDLGVHLSVDDFGTGYSSLSYLRELPVSEVKVDRSFVMRMAIDGGDAAIVKSIVDLARNLSLRVVAEGIEDRATWNMLAEFGCDLGQGYFISRPLPTQDFVTWLQRDTAAHPRPRLSVVGHMK